MAKVIVTLNGLLQQEISILKPRLTIGRRSNNDLVLDQLTVSGQHAAIDTTSIGVFILDLGSTNGTLVNGQPITKHLLQHDDVLEIGKYKIKYQHDLLTSMAPEQSLSTPASKVSVQARATPNEEIQLNGRLKVLNGSNAGKELVLAKSVTTMGTPGRMVITLSRHGQVYLLAQVEGDSLPKINDQELSAQPCQIHDGDVIDLMGMKMQFYRQ
jgi:pSer/pThr/pTyr-binding forkhead associated (FHA) protein